MTTATKRRGGSTSTKLGNVPMCKAMVACDGDNLTPARKAKGYCGKCEETAAKRGISLESK